MTAIEIFSRSRFPTPEESHVNSKERSQFLHSSGMPYQ